MICNNFNMKHLIIFSCALLSLLAACKQDSSSKSGNLPDAQKDKIVELAGNWISIDFCSRASQYGSVLGAMNYGHKPYAYSVTFSPVFPDSVECSNGVKTWKLPITIKADTVEVKGARPENKSVFLIVDLQGREKQLTMFDPAPSGMEMDKFIKSKAGSKNGYTDFLAALNHNMFNGVYTEVGKPKPADDKRIQFTPGGYIMEFKDYDRYELCTAGDCFFLGPDQDVMTLRQSKKEDSAKSFMYKFSNHNDTLRLYDLIHVNPDDKYSYKLGKQAYAFARKPAE